MIGLEVKKRRGITNEWQGDITINVVLALLYFIESATRDLSFPSFVPWTFQK
jgi:hypothetical protein